MQVPSSLFPSRSRRQRARAGQQGQQSAPQIANYDLWSIWDSAIAPDSFAPGEVVPKATVEELVIDQISAQLGSEYMAAWNALDVKAQRSLLDAAFPTANYLV
jgi:hypothetical protein